MDLARVNRFFKAWYQPKYHMHKEDWIYIGALVLASMCAFGVGLLIGLVWASLL